MWIPNIRNRGPNFARFFGSHRGHHQGQSFGNFVWRIFCRKTFCGRHTISLVEVLTCQANPLRSFLRAALAPSHTAGDHAGRRPCSIQSVACLETGAAGCTVAFRPAHAHLRAGLGRCQPYAPAGWCGGSGKLRVLPEYSWQSSELSCQTTPKQASHF